MLNKIKEKIKQLYADFNDLAFFFIVVGVLFFPVLIALFVVCQRSLLVIILLLSVVFTALSALYVILNNKKIWFAIVFLDVLIFSAVYFYGKTLHNKFSQKIYSQFDNINWKKIYTFYNSASNDSLVKKLGNTLDTYLKTIRKAENFCMNDTIFQKEKNYIDIMEMMLAAYYEYDDAFKFYWLPDCIDECMDSDSIIYWKNYNIIRHFFAENDINAAIDFLKKLQNKHTDLKDTAMKYFDIMLSNYIRKLNDTGKFEFNKKLFLELFKYIKEHKDNSVYIEYKFTFSNTITKMKFYENQYHFKYSAPLSGIEDATNLFSNSFKIDDVRTQKDQPSIYINVYFFSNSKIFHNYYSGYYYKIFYNLKAYGYAYVNGKKFKLKFLKLTGAEDMYDLIDDFNENSYKLFEK